MPGRELVKEGELVKMSRKGTNARHFVLLSDCLLYCTVGAYSSLRVSYTIPLDSLQTSLQSQTSLPEVTSEEDLEFSITSNVRSCTLRARCVNIFSETFLTNVHFLGISLRGMSGWRPSTVQWRIIGTGKRALTTARRW